MRKLDLSWKGSLISNIKSQSISLIILMVFIFLIHIVLEWHLHNTSSAENHDDRLLNLIFFFINHLSRDTAISLLVAIVVIFKIEMSHRQHLDSEIQHYIEVISENIFGGVFNTNLPKDYTRSVMDILKINLVRENVSLEYTISDGPNIRRDDSVIKYLRLECSLSYNIVNIGSERVTVPIQIGIPNPFDPKLQRDVTILGAEVNGKSVLKQSHNDALQQGLSLQSNEIIVCFSSIDLNPGDSPGVKINYIMVKEEEDTETLRSSYACKSMSLRVFDKTVHGLYFGADAIRSGQSEKQSSEYSTSAHHWEIKGYLLPWQGFIFWWKRNTPTPQLGLAPLQTEDVGREQHCAETV